MKINKKDIMFFAENAGYCTPPGRMVCAKSLANAESLGNALGLEVKWEYDPCPDTSWCTKKDLKDIEDGTIEIFQAYIKDDSGYTLAALGGIFLRVDDRNYRRVIEAELMNEALETIKKGN